MRKLQYILFLIPVFLFVDLAHAGDKEDVLATMDAIMGAWIAGDVDGARKHMLSRPKTFEADGSLLSSMDFEAAKAGFAAGLKFNVKPAHSDVTIYGDAAVLTGYLMRQMTPPGGTLVTMTLRATVVFVKQNGQWKVSPAHLSPLTPENPK